MMEIDFHEFAKDWIESWNSHDLDRILAHYTDDCELTTPMIKVALGVETGALKGKPNMREYWDAALKKVADLRFELIEVMGGVDSIAIYYKGVFDKRAVEVLFLDSQNKVYKAVVLYS